MNQFFDFVASELSEPETRDVDNLFDCLRDNLMDMGRVLSERDEDDLYNEIERQVEADVRAAVYAGGD